MILSLLGHSFPQSSITHSSFDSNISLFLWVTATVFSSFRLSQSQSQCLHKKNEWYEETIKAVHATLTLSEKQQTRVKIYDLLNRCSWDEDKRGKLFSDYYSYTQHRLHHSQGCIPRTHHMIIKIWTLLCSILLDKLRYQLGLNTEFFFDFCTCCQWLHPSVTNFSPHCYKIT